MKHSLEVLLFLLLLLFGCKKANNSNGFSDHKITESHEISATPITYNPRYTYDEWITSIFDELFLDEPEALLHVFDLNLNESTIDLLFAVQHTDSLGLYTLKQKPDNTFDFESVSNFQRSSTASYSKASWSNVSVYEILYTNPNQNGNSEILMISEIFGMTEAENGMRPFNKIHQDLFELKNGKVVFNQEKTKNHNSRLGIQLSTEAKLTVLQYLSYKYPNPIDKSLNRQKLIDLLIDLGFAPKTKKENFDVLVPVRNVSQDYMLDLGYLEYELSFLVDNNTAQIEDPERLGFPYIYIEDHGEYLYSIEHAKIENDIITLDLKFLYYKDENTGELDTTILKDTTMTITPYNEEWVVTYLGNSLMLTRVADRLPKMNSNEGQ